MAPTQLVKSSLPKDLAEAFTQTQVELIKSVIAKDATNDELKLFLYTAKRTGLDPLTKQIHFVKRSQKKKLPNGSWVDEPVMTIQTGIDGYRAIADRTGKLAGIDDAVFDTEEDVHPNKASVTVMKLVEGNLVKYTASARWSEYAVAYKDKFGNEKLGPMWQKMPYLMLAKCAEALALRKAFPNDLSGLYTNEEMAQADNAQPGASQSVQRASVRDTGVQEEPQQDLPVIQADQEIEPQEVQAEVVTLACSVCGDPITTAEERFSRRMYNQPLCRTHQAEARNQ